MGGVEYTTTLIDRSANLSASNSQGVAYDGTHYYYTDSFTIYKYTRDAETNAYTLVDSHDTTADATPADIEQINGMNFYNGYLWIGASNYPNTPKKGYILQYDPATLAHVATFTTAAYWSEGGAWHNVGNGDEFWAIYHDQPVVSRYRINAGAFELVANYNLAFVTGQTTYLSQSAVWLGDLFIVQNHGYREVEPATTDVYRWNGAGMDAVQKIPRLSVEAGQGIHWEVEGSFLLFAERNGVNGNAIVRATWAET